MQSVGKRWSVLACTTVALCGGMAASTGAAVAAPIISVFATGAAVGGTQPDSITYGDGSVWVEYANGANGTGTNGRSSTIVRYSPTGAVQATISLPGNIDGLKVQPGTGTVVALANQDGNSSQFLINPTTNTASAAIPYAVPSATRGYDDVAFLGGQTYLSHTNPAAPTDGVIEQVNAGSNPITYTSVLPLQTTARDTVTGQPVLITDQDVDSLKTTPDGRLQLTNGDQGRLLFVGNPGATNQTVDQLLLVHPDGTPITSLDDASIVSASDRTLLVTDTGLNTVFAVSLDGVTPGSLLVSEESSPFLDLADPATGLTTPFTTFPNAIGANGSTSGPHGQALVSFAVGATAVPEPVSLVLLGGALAGLGVVRRCQRPA